MPENRMKAEALKGLNREELRQKLQQAAVANDAEAFGVAFDAMMELIGTEIREEYDAKIQGIKDDLDTRALQARGVKPLTSKEREYYQKLAEAMKSADPKAALQNGNLVLPETVVNRVFDELQTEHPLLSRIAFIPTGGAVKFLLNTNGYQVAQWGKLCDDIVKEILGGFQEVDTNLLKLSAFIPVCKALLELGPEWLDDFIRQTLYEALANGLEAGIVSGTGNDMPIGMDRQVGEGVTVTGGVYPVKAPITVTDLKPETIGNLLALLAVDAGGKVRRTDGVILVVNPVDYLRKVFPATTIMAPDGTYRRDVMPYPMDVIPSIGLPEGKAIIGLGRRYAAFAGMPRNGRIEYSDHYRFLEDDRVYLIKLYANGMPMDNNAFQVLDISGLTPAVLRVETVSGMDPVSTNANLSGLRIGALALTPAFAAATTTYTAATTNATNTINAVPADANASIAITVNGAAISNGAAATWQAGENTVVVTVTAENGSTTKAYTITVTKS